jgi:hypothetical protein
VVLEIILREETFHQTSKEAKKLWEEISFLQQKMQPCDRPVKFKIVKLAGQQKAVVSLCSKQVDVR